MDFDQDQDLEEEQLNLEKEQLNEEDHRDPQYSALKGKPQASFSSGVSSLQDPPSASDKRKMEHLMLWALLLRK